MVNSRIETRPQQALVSIEDRDVPVVRKFARIEHSMAFLTQMIAINADVETYRLKRRSQPQIAIAAYRRAKALG